MVKSKTTLNELGRIINDLGNEANHKKILLLKELEAKKLTNSKEIKQYHDQLLFLMSYAPNAEILELANSERNRLTLELKKNEIMKSRLIGSGISGTVIQSAFSLTLIKWLIEKFPGSVFLHSFDETGTHPKEVLKDCMPDIEFELLSDEKLNAEKWIAKASGTKDKNKMLHWLITTFDQLNASWSIKDQLFESLKVYVEINTTNPVFSRSFGKVETTSTFLHEDGIVKKFDELSIINKKLPREKKLNNKQKEEILTASRVALCVLNRETDPITYCNENSIKYFELERGLSIALFCIDSERRLPIESYVGFMMFKNGYPMSYGGAWLFGKRSLIGINIFESFRGGESAFVFAQLLRCYRMAFGATYFEVEPYQFGKHNPEGIHSGAFWFYYRFGFRPCNKELFDLSKEEHLKIISNKGYRSSYEVLKQFTSTNLFVFFDDTTHIPLNPAHLSRFVTHKLATGYNGDRKKATKKAIHILKQKKIILSNGNSVGVNKLALMIYICFDFLKLNQKTREVLKKMIIDKGRSEFDYILLCRRLNPEHLLNLECKAYIKTL